MRQPFGCIAPVFHRFFALGVCDAPRSLPLGKQFHKPNPRLIPLLSKENRPDFRIWPEQIVIRFNRQTGNNRKMSKRIN